jgi:myo-inositol catabolism protein IolS
MQRRKLGSSDLEITVVGFGAWEAGGVGWGPNPPDDQVIQAIRAGLDAGINWIDTAEIYGNGRSEELVGAAVRDRRDEVVIATKIAPEASGIHPEEVRSACEASLKRLDTDRIDLYQIHWPPHGAPIEETWAAMAALEKEGLVRAIGVSNFDRELIERCQRIRHVDSLQPHFSLLHPQNRDLIAWCGEQQIGVVAYGPLGFGLLTGAITATTRFGGSDWRTGRSGMGYYPELFAPGKLERSLALVDALRPIAERLGITLGQLALAWVIQQPGSTSAIAGTRNAEHVKENAAAGAVEFDPATLEEIEALIPVGPGPAE